METTQKHTHLLLFKKKNTHTKMVIESRESQFKFMLEYMTSRTGESCTTAQTEPIIEMSSSELDQTFGLSSSSSSSSSSSTSFSSPPSSYSISNLSTSSSQSITNPMLTGSMCSPYSYNVSKSVFSFLFLIFQ